MNLLSKSGQMLQTRQSLKERTLFAPRKYVLDKNCIIQDAPVCPVTGIQYEESHAWK
jgi:hypothetical protein